MSIQRFNSDNRDIILRYLEAGGNQENQLIELNDIQTKLLDRWRFADEKIREQKYRREAIANFIIGKYEVSRDTAFRDMVCAEYVFASSAPLNKQYLIGIRIEYLQKKIQEAYIDNDRFNAANLEKVLQKYIHDYPDYQAPKSPKNIIYNIIQNNGNDANNMDVEDAIVLADDILKKLEDNEDY